MSASIFRAAPPSVAPAITVGGEGAVSDPLPSLSSCQLLLRSPSGCKLICRQLARILHRIDHPSSQFTDSRLLEARHRRSDCSRFEAERGGSREVADKFGRTGWGRAWSGPRGWCFLSSCGGEGRLIVGKRAKQDSRSFSGPRWGTTRAGTGEVRSKLGGGVDGCGDR